MNRKIVARMTPHNLNNQPILPKIVMTTNKLKRNFPTDILIQNPKTLMNNLNQMKIMNKKT